MHAASTIMDGKLDLRPRMVGKIHYNYYDGGVPQLFKYLAGSSSGLVTNNASPEVGVYFPLQSVLPVVESIFSISPY